MIQRALSKIELMCRDGIYSPKRPDRCSMTSERGTPYAQNGRDGAYWLRHLVGSGVRSKLRALLTYLSHNRFVEDLTLDQDLRKHSWNNIAAMIFPYIKRALRPFDRTIRSETPSNPFAHIQSELFHKKSQPLLMHTCCSLSFASTSPSQSPFLST